MENFLARSGRGNGMGRNREHVYSSYDHGPWKGRKPFP